LGFPILAFFHLLTHALFKALLFICAGAIIHNMKNSQDIRLIGALVLFMPFTIVCLNVANLALCGIPFLAGFYSKDLILETVLVSNINIIIVVLFFIATGLTVCYSFRLVYYSLTGAFEESSLNCLNDERWGISLSMLILLGLVMIGGATLRWLLFSSSLVIVLPLYLKLLVLLTCIIGGLIGYALRNISIFRFNKSLRINFLSYFNGQIWFIPVISTTGINSFPLQLGYISLKGFDQGWSEFFGGQKIYTYIKIYATFNQRLHNNNLKIYLILFIFWFVVLVLLLINR